MANKNILEKFCFERNCKLFTSYIRSIKKDIKTYIRREDLLLDKLRWEVLVDRGILFDLIVSNVKSGIEIKVICTSRNFKSKFITYDTKIGSKLLTLFDSVKTFDEYFYD